MQIIIEFLILTLTLRMSSKSKSESKSSRSSSKSSKSSSKSSSKDIIYFDNNAHTIICPKAEEALIKWSKYYNPSSDNKFAKESREVMQKAVKFMHEQTSTTSDTHTVLFTSGATESNCTILRSVAYAVKKLPNKLIKPYIIASAIEHHSIIQCLEDLKSENACEIEYIKPNGNGQINPSDLEKKIEQIKGNGGIVALVTIMFANNETGAINNIPKIGEICAKHETPFHSDAVQIFGKYRVNMPNLHINAMSASFHKLYGPGGIGLLVIDNELIKGYELTGIISGTQQSGLRGGTENIPAIASAMEATKWAFTNRTLKNDKLLAMKERIVEKLKKHYPFGELMNYIIPPDNTPDKPIEEKLDLVEVKDSEIDESKIKGDKIGGASEMKPLELVIIGNQKEGNCLPNTLMLSIAKNKGESFCNVAFKTALAKRNVIVSIASACLTSSPKASHVLTAMDLPSVIKKGVLRISLGDYNTTEECDRFVQIFLETLDSTLKHMDKLAKGPVIGE